MTKPALCLLPCLLLLTACAGVSVERIRSDLDAHARAARDLAEERLDSDKVLATFLERVGSGL